jgi:hypothetical protein
MILATHGFPWAELVTSVGGGLVGGLIGGLFAVLAQDKAIQAQRESDREAESRQIKGVLKAIEDELFVIEHWLIGSLGTVFPKGVPTNQPQAPVKIPFIDQNLFTIYDSNAGNLGKVPDEETRHLIVRTYTRAKTLIDMVNQYSARYQAWDRLRHGTGTEPSQSQQIFPELMGWSAEIRRLLDEIKPFVAALKERLQSS